jgi:hypothetical protein
MLELNVYEMEGHAPKVSGISNFMCNYLKPMSGELGIGRRRDINNGAAQGSL